MKNCNCILLTLITATTLLLFIPISAYSSEKTEQWELIDDGRGQANVTLIQAQDGTITSDGNWVYNYQGASVSGSYANAPMTISGSSISINATGTATNPSAPAGYNTSPYTLSINGTVFNGQGDGSFTITFQAIGWPNKITGIWGGKRISGSGITAETVKIKAMPWLLLLLK
ncbi:MAG: hypothetical protein NTY00_09525 [Deltaproteobacteria bacterium]|nr:hypothetical protein [Deltaproteobacteria bacterium]